MQIDTETEMAMVNNRRLEKELKAARAGLLDQFAMAALTGLAADRSRPGFDIAEQAYKLAAAMLHYRDEQARRAELPPPCAKCGEPGGRHWLDGGETCPRCRLVQ